VVIGRPDGVRVRVKADLRSVTTGMYDEWMGWVRQTSAHKWPAIDPDAKYVLEFEDSRDLIAFVGDGRPGKGWRFYLVGLGPRLPGPDATDSDSSPHGGARDAFWPHRLGSRQARDTRSSSRPTALDGQPSCSHGHARLEVGLRVPVVVRCGLSKDGEGPGSAAHGPPKAGGPPAWPGCPAPTAAATPRLLRPRAAEVIGYRRRMICWHAEDSRSISGRGSHRVGWRAHWRSRGRRWPTWT
jgi:hypothetical protein